MSINENKALERREIEEFWNKKNLAIVDEILDTNYVSHTTMGDFKGREGFLGFVNMLITALPDCQATIEDIIAEENKVVSRVTLRGTHKGNLMGIPPTGKQIVLTEIAVHHVANGKYLESWGIADMLGLLQQLGVIPRVGQP